MNINKMNAQGLGRLEGNPASKLLQLMRKHGYNSDIEMRVATVTKTSPLSIRIKGDPFDLSDDELIIADHLKKHTRTATISNANITGSTTNADGHSHGIQSITLKNATIEFESKLKVGDDVIVIVADSGQLYYVMDKA